MNFKIHLIIISLIIVALYLVRSFVASQPYAPQVVIQTPTASQYSISIARASWGLNCISLFKSMNSQGGSTDYYTQDVDMSKIKEDNVLTQVSNLCNGKSSCEIPINTSTLGEDPLSNCGSKILEVDYRCFSVDKLRIAKSSTATISIDCDKQIK